MIDPFTGALSLLALRWRWPVLRDSATSVRGWPLVRYRCFTKESRATPFYEVLFVELSQELFGL